MPAAEATGGTVQTIALQSDNRILIAKGGLTPTRLLTDGSLDPTFHPQPLDPGVTRFNQVRNWAIESVTATADGKVLVAAFVDLRFTNDYPLPNSKVVRFQNDGTVDSSFSPIQWNGYFNAVRALDDGGVLAIGSLADTGFSVALAPPTNGLIVRARSDGSPNPAYASPAILPTGASCIYSNGAAILTGALQQSPGPVRFTSLGAVDPGFTGGVGQPSLIAPTNNDQVYVAGAFNIYNGKPAHLVARLNAVANGSVNAPRILSFAADKTTVAYGEPVTVRAAVTGSADLTFDWTGAPLVLTQDGNTLRTTSATLTFTFSSTSQSTFLTLTARNPAGAAVSVPIVFTVLPDPPVITSQPTHVSAQSGRDLVLSIARNPTAGSTLDIEWRKNGQLLPAAPWYFGPALSLPKVTAADAGTYTLTLRNALGAAVTSTPILLTIDDSSRFTNLSTRAFVGPGEQTLIAGFSVSGVNSRTVLIRSIGPGLAKFGVTDALSNPQLRLIEAGTDLDYSHSFSSDGWDASSTDGNAFLRAAFAKVGAFPLDAGSKDNAGTATIGPGNYTVQVTNKSSQSGTALVEIYEFDNDAARMLNVSSRAMVIPGAPAICGLSIQGPVPKRVLLRGAGPALGVFGVSRVLADPRLTLKDANGVTVATNDDWETGANVNDLRAAMPAVGAFAFSSGSKDAALLTNLAPGNYTMIVEGAPGQSGVALVEAYEVP